MCFVCKSYVVLALLPLQCAVFCVCTTASAVCCICKSCVVFALLPVQCAVCVIPVLCLLNVLSVQFAMWGLRQVILLLFYFAIFYCTTANAVYCVCKSCVVFALLPAQCAVCCVCTTASAVCCVLCLHYCQLSVLCVSPALWLLNVLSVQFAMWGLWQLQVFLLLFYFTIFYCTTASAVCCVCKSCVVFALLPAQCAVFCVCTTASAVCCMLCSHYCQLSVLCV